MVTVCNNNNNNFKQIFSALITLNQAKNEQHIANSEYKAFEKKTFKHNIIFM